MCSMAIIHAARRLADRFEQGRPVCGWECATDARRAGHSLPTVYEGNLARFWHELAYD